MIKVRHQLNRAPLNSVQILKEIYRKNGLWNGVFRGFLITLVVMSIDIFHNSTLARIIFALELESSHTGYDVVFLLFALAVYPPLDLAKTAIQVHDTEAVDIEKTDEVCYQQLQRSSCVTDENKTNAFKILWSVYVKRGYKGLYAGVIAIAIRMILFFMAYTIPTLIILGIFRF